MITETDAQQQIQQGTAVADYPREQTIVSAIDTVGRRPIRSGWHWMMGNSN
ncbi:hypothetical protein P4S72_07730 [Vibrio sp. PP-XX7]